MQKALITASRKIQVFAGTLQLNANVVVSHTHSASAHVMGAIAIDLRPIGACQRHVPPCGRE